MGIVFAVLVGGAVGSLLRFSLSKVIQEKAGIDFPLGTFAVNIGGAFLIGVAFALLVERFSISPEMRALIITGFLGGLTTFSTFSYESFILALEGELFKFLLYVLGTNLVGILMTVLGYSVGRLL